MTNAWAETPENIREPRQSWVSRDQRYERGPGSWQLFRMYALPSPTDLTAGGYDQWLRHTKGESLWVREAPFTAKAAMLDVVANHDHRLRPSYMLAWVERLLLEAKVLRDTSVIVAEAFYRDDRNEVMAGRLRVILWEPRSVT